MTLITRAEWGAALPRSRMATMHYPVSRVYIHHTVTVPSNDVYRDARTVQEVAFSRGFSDVSYTVLVHPSGAVLEGRELIYQGAHTRGWNHRSVAVALIGNYESATPTGRMMDGILEAIWWLRDVRALRTIDDSVYGHRDAAATACPGRYAYNRLPELRRRLMAGRPIKEDDDMPAYIHEIIPPDSIMYTIAIPPPMAGLVPAGRVFVSFGVDSVPTSVRAVAGTEGAWYGLGPEDAWEFEVPVGRKVWKELQSGDEVVSVINWGPRHIGVLVEVGRQ